MILINTDWPKADDEFVELVIFGDGRVLQTGESWRNPSDGKTYYTTTTPEKHFLAEKTPAHGDLIDRDALKEQMSNLAESYGWWFVLCKAPTVIPAKEDET